MSTLQNIDRDHGCLAFQQVGGVYSILCRPSNGLFGFLRSKVVEILPKDTWTSLRYRNDQFKPELRVDKGDYKFILPRGCFTGNFISTSCGWKYPEDNSMFGNIVEMPNFEDFFGYYENDDGAVFVVMHVEKKGMISMPLDEVSFILSTEHEKPFVNGFGFVYLPPELWGRFIPRF